jgi:hypothetical protein
MTGRALGSIILIIPKTILLRVFVRNPLYSYATIARSALDQTGDNRSRPSPSQGETEIKTLALYHVIKIIQ